MEVDFYVEGDVATRKERDNGLYFDLSKNNKTDAKDDILKKSHCVLKCSQIFI